MKFLFLVIIFIILNNCSFDKKSGIWKNEQNISSKKEKDIFSDFKKISDTKEIFNTSIILDNEFKFKISPPIDNYQWQDIFYKKNNNLDNFNYTEKNELSSLGKKISRQKIDNYFLFENNNIITTDLNGNIFIFSINQNIVLNKFNFYKKRYKKIKKKLNIIVENNIVYVSDNLGYLYAYDYIENKLIWGKKYKAPFRSNLKISKKKLITSNQDNHLIFFNKNNGDLIKLIPTEESVVKNKFVNNISLNQNYLIYLNSFGSLYSIDLESMELIWFINLRENLDLNPSNLFLGNQIINNDNIIVASSSESSYIVDINNGSILYKQNFSSDVRPVIYNNYVFFLTKNNFLICFDIIKNKILYSYEVNQLIADFLDSKKNNLTFKSLMIVNNKIFIFLENSYLVKFNLNGKLLSIDKLASKINTMPILVKGSIMFINNRNKLAIID